MRVRCSSSVSPIRKPATGYWAFGWDFDVPDLLVRAQGLSKRYFLGASTVRAVTDVSLSIGVGEFAVIKGRSGSGKSTLLHLLGLLERPDTGRYWLAGREVDYLSQDERAGMRSREIGFVFQ